MSTIITKEALEENMRVKLQAFNNEKVEITNDTIHRDLLSGGGAKKEASDRMLYRGAILWTVFENGGGKIKLPGNWLDHTVSELADSIISKLPQ
jgi:hypothetical protein